MESLALLNALAQTNDIYEFSRYYRLLLMVHIQHSLVEGSEVLAQNGTLIFAYSI